MSERRVCSECGRRLDGIMSSDPAKPGLLGLLGGQGEDLALNAAAWAFVLFLIFVLAAGVFATIGAAL